MMVSVMFLFPFQSSNVDFKFFPARYAGAEVQVCVREFSVLGPNAPVAVSGGNSGATVVGGAEDHLVPGADIP